MRLALLALVACSGKAPVDTGGGGGGAGEDAGPALASAVADAGPDVVVEVGAEATLDGTASVGVAFRWDLGDGQTADGASVAHAWAEPGNYTAVLQVTGEDGGTRADSVLVVVHNPLLDEAPVWSGTLGISPDGGTLYAVVPEAGTVARISTGSGALSEWRACGEPVSLSVRADGVVGVACADGRVVLGLEAGDLVLSTPGGVPARAVVPAGPAWWVSVPALEQVYTVSDGEIVEERWDVGPDVRALAVAGGEVFAARWRSADDGGEVHRRGGGSIHLPVYDRGSSDTTTNGVPNLIEQVVPTPDGAALVLPMAHSNLLRGGFRNGEVLAHDFTIRAVAGFVAPDAVADDLDDRKQFDDRGRANAAAPSPFGDRIYMAHTGTRTVSILDRWSHNLVGSIPDVGRAPTGLAVSRDGDVLYVYAWLDREVRAYDVSGATTPPAERARWSVVEEEPLAADVLLGKQVFWDAADKRITRAGYISCANCHPDGDHDGRTWDFTDRGEGLRNTPTLLGRAGMGMGPVHWSANFDEIQDFENDMRGPFGGEGFLSAADWDEAGDTLGPPKAGRSPELDALAAYVQTLDATPASPHLAEPGDEQAFLDAGCADCHPAPRYTDSSLDTFLRHDVGTLWEGSGGRLGVAPLDGLDTPTLLGAWATAPYLHDGSVDTLEDAIAAHETGAALDAEALGAVARFVRSL